MNVRYGVNDPILEATIAEAQSITAVKREVRAAYGRIDHIDVAARAPKGAGPAANYTIDSREWGDEDDADIEFWEYKRAAKAMLPGMELDLYCYALEIAGKPEYGGSLVGNVDMRLFSNA